MTVSKIPIQPPLWHQSWLPALITFVVVLICFQFDLSEAPLAGTEAHRAVTAHQMVSSGEWLIPRLYGRLYLRKPPLHYWILASVQSAIGYGSEGVWRTPSAVAFATLCAAMGAFAGRWFGVIARWVGGFACFAIVAVWQQSRSADIDAMNTLASALAACCILELHFGKGRNQWRWTMAAGLCTGATLMLKGPAGLPIIFGAIIGPAFFLRDASGIKNLKTLIVILLALLPLALWWDAATRSLLQQLIKFDYSGLNEAGENVVYSSRKSILQILALAPQLFLFSLPVSVSLLLMLDPRVRGATPAEHRPMLLAITGAVLGSWVICTLSGMRTVRYGYPTLPLLAPLLAGVIGGVLNLSRSNDPAIVKEAARNLRLSINVASIAFLIGAAAFAVLAWRLGNRSPLLIASVAASGVICAGVLFKSPATRRASILLVAQVAILTLPASQFDIQNNRDRSGLAAASILREQLGAGTRILVGAALRYQPELLFYAELNAYAVGEELPNPATLPEGGWCLLDADEHAKWSRKIPHRMGELVHVVSNKKNLYAVRLLPVTER